MDTTIGGQTTITTSALTDYVMIDRAGVNYKVSFQTAVLDRAYPIGAFYIQYPGGADPNTAIGGTWLNDSATFAADFFRVDDGGVLANAFNGGVQADQLQGFDRKIIGDNSTAGGFAVRLGHPSANGFLGNTDITTPFTTEVFPLGNRVFNEYVADNYGNGTPRVGTTTYPKNQTVRVWKRTA